MSSDDENDYAAQPEDISETIDVDYPVDVETAVPQGKGQLFKTVLRDGTGSRPPKGSKVTVHYVGTLVSDGSKFDSSRDRDEHFEFTLGQGQVIKGWDVGVATMRKGEKCILRCEPDFAYGAAGSPPKIPANSALNFEVELFDWSKMEDISTSKDKSLLKSVLVEGKDWERPDYETSLTAHFAILTGDEDDSPVIRETRDWAIVIGDEELPDGLEAALKTMKKGEVAQIKVAKVKQAHSAFPEIKVGEAAYYKVELLQFEKVKTWSVTNENKTAEAKKRKDAGNEFFKKAQYAKAIEKYKRGLEFIEYVDGLEEPYKAEAASLKITMWSNTAQCHLTTGNIKACIEFCNKVLAEEPNNQKALFRRGKAHGQTQNWDDGCKDMKRILELDPANADAARELAALQEAIRQNNAREKSMFSRMFK